MMDDQMLQLAFSVYKNPGVYALLLGSGVSRSAEILTGWDIMNDLIAQIGAALGEEIAGKPADWFRRRFKEEPGYDVLLKKLGRLPAEREAILRPYFVPTDEEREEGTKLPTRAHRAIAWLIKEKYIQVVLTTNFDRLLETALLDEVGIRPNVVSTEAQLGGMHPLQHSSCTIIKLHGDYVDGELKNTPEELETYSRKKDRLLDRVFDEYGLIVCGWSGDWDTALRRAIERTKQRRYSTFWAEYAPQPKETAQSLINRRDAQVIANTNADDFFENLKNMVVALEGSFRSNPLTVAVAIQHTKKLLSNPNGQIELEEYFRAEIERAYEAFTGSEFRGRRKEIAEATKDEPQKMLEAVWEFYYGIIEIPLNMAATIAWYGNQDNSPYFTEALERWVELPTVGGQDEKYVIWRFLPALTLIYVVGIAAMSKGNWMHLPYVLQQPRVFSPWEGQELTLTEIIGHELILEGFLRKFQLLRFSELVSNILRTVFRELLPSEQNYLRVFDSFDLLWGLVYIDQASSSNRDWAPGRSVIFQNRSWNALIDFWKRAAGQGENWEALKVGLFKGQPDRVQDALKNYMVYARSVRGRGTLSYHLPDFSQIYGDNRNDNIPAGGMISPPDTHPLA